MDEFTMKLPDHPRGGVVHIRDGLSIHHEPAHGRRSWPNQAPNLLRKQTRVGIEERCSEAIDNQPRLGECTGRGWHSMPCCFLGSDEHSSVRTIAVPHNPE